jgi:hypothetical protein
MRITHPGCEAVWSGLNIEHCAACHQTFSGTEAGDKHRVGDHGVTEGPNRRRCLTVEEMHAKVTGNGDPWYEVAPNAHGTLVWSRRRVARGTSHPHWNAGQRVIEGVEGTPGYSGTPLDSGTRPATSPSVVSEAAA